MTQILHLAQRQDAPQGLHVGPSLCGAGGARQHPQYIAGDAARVTCKTCLRRLAQAQAGDVDKAVA